MRTATEGQFGDIGNTWVGVQQPDVAISSCGLSIFCPTLLLFLFICAYVCVSIMCEV